MYRICKWLIIIPFIMFFSLQIYFFHFTLDDSFITFRYAENFVEHGKLVWNLDEDPVEGYSNFLWLIISTIPLSLNLDVVIFMKFIGLIFGLITLYFLQKLSKLFYKDYCWIPLLFLSLSYYFAIWSVSGMETSFFILLLLMSIYFFIKEIRGNESYKSSFLFFLLALTRPEGAIIFVFSFFYRLLLVFKKKEHIKKFIFWSFTFIIPYLVYFLWRLIYYGSIFPNTFYAKRELFGGLGYIIEFLLVYFPFIFLELLILFWKRDKELFYIFTIQLTFFLSVLNINPIMGEMYRFLLPALPISFLFLPFIFSLKLNQRFVKYFNKIVLFVLLVLFLTTFVSFSSTLEGTRTYSFNINHLNIPLGKGLYDKNITIALGDAGAIPFYSRLKTIDLFGLNDKFIAHNGFDVDYVLNQKPNLIILRSKEENQMVPVDKESLMLFSNDDFLSRFKLIKTMGYNLIDESKGYYWIFVKIS